MGGGGVLEIVVCDDDADDLDIAVTMLHEIFTGLGISCHIKAFLSGAELLNSVRALDIGVLDIAMNGIDGMKLGRKLREKFPEVKLVYMTSYEEYCIQVINEVHAFSFLCKPLDRCEMEAQITEAVSRMPDAALEKEFYHVKDSGGKEYDSIKLRLNDILYLEYIKRSRKASIVTVDETYECECIFEKLVEELQECDFAVNCRGNLVNLHHVGKIKGFSIYLDNGEELPIAQRRVADFREKISTFLQRNS